jgi:hypothetical protein
MTTQAEPKVWVFFYGSNINFDVLEDGGLVPGEWEVARSPGFDIRIAPTANLIRSERDVVWGINATATHAELGGLYRDYVQGKLGQIYLPEAILTCTVDGKVRPAMTYVCHAMIPRPADPAYVERITGPARQFGFPSWYIERLEGFRSSRASVSDDHDH